MTASKGADLDAVALNWSGDVCPFDVERATPPDLPDAVRLATGTYDTQAIAPVLSDGVTYYYGTR